MERQNGVNAGGFAECQRPPSWRKCVQRHAALGNPKNDSQSKSQAICIKITPPRNINISGGGVIRNCHSSVLQVAWSALNHLAPQCVAMNDCRWLYAFDLGLFPLDKTIVFHFYDFVLVLSAVSSRCQLYSVGPSEGKLIPNSVFFIQSFREFRA